MTEGTTEPTPTTRALALAIAVLLGAYLLVTSTVTLHETLWKFDVKRILELWLLPVFFIAVLLTPGLRAAFQNQMDRLPPWMRWTLGAIVVLGVVSAVHNNVSAWSLLYSLSEVALLSLLGVAVFCIAACRNVAGLMFDQVTVVLLAMVGLAVGLQELIGVFAALSQGLEFHPRIALLHFSWPRFYNQVQAWSMPLIAALPLLFPGKPLVRLFCIVTLALEWYVVIATGARGTTVGVVFAIVIGCVLFPAIRKTMIGYQVGGLLAGVLIYAAVVSGHQILLADATIERQVNERPSDSASAVEGASPDREVTSEELAEAEKARKARSTALQNMGESSGEYMEPITGKRMWTSSGRMRMWRDSLHDAQTHPLLGTGPMNYACKGPVYREGHPHNFPLQFLSEWGAPAFLLLLVLGGQVGFAMLRALRQPVQLSSGTTAVAPFFATGVLSALILSTLDGVFVMPESQVTGVLVGGGLLGMMVHRQNRLAGRHSEPSANRWPLILAGVAICLSLAFLVFAQHEIRVSAKRFEQTPVMDRGIPRLWQNGKVCALYANGISSDD